MTHFFHDLLVDRYFRGALRPRANAAVLERLSYCAGCRARYARHLLLEQTLPDGEARSQARLWRTICESAKAGAPPDSPEQGWVPRFLPATALVVSGALAALLLMPRAAPPERAAEPVARGGLAEHPSAPSVHLFKTAGGEAEAIGTTLHRDDAVLVAYSNPSSDLGHLLLFAVDGAGHIYWYYPAYERAGDNPAAARIRTRASGVELGEEIRHSLMPGPLRFFAIFLPRPWHVQAAEALVEQHWRAQGRSLSNMDSLPIGEGHQISRLVEVEQ